MAYAGLLATAVKESGWSLSVIVLRCTDHGVNISRTYLSKLCNAKRPPASDRVNKALAEVLAPVSSITYDALRLAAYKDTIPGDIQKALIEEALQGVRCG